MTKTLRKWMVAGALAGFSLGGMARADDAEALPPPPSEVAAQPNEDAGAIPAPPAAPEAPAEAPLVAMTTPELPAITSVPRLPPPPPPPAPRAEADEPFWLGDIAPKLKIEARLDAGQIAETQDGTAYAAGRDAYIKKAKFGVGGRLLSSGKYSVLAIGEHIGQDGRDPVLKLDRAYVEYAFARALVVRGGKAKLPLSRGSLMSSNDVFLRDPAVVDAIDKVYGDDTEWNLQLRGSTLLGVLSWAGAIAQGLQQGDAIHKTAGATTVESAGPLLVGRVELAVPGFTDALEDTRPGRGRRISLGASYSRQKDIRYVGGAGAEDRQLASVDVTMRVGPFSAVTEVDGWIVDSSVAAVGRKTPVGGYGQVAVFLPWIKVEPAIRYEAYWEKLQPGTDQETLSLGLNWYPRMDRLKLSAELMKTEFGPLSSGRLASATERTRVQLGADFSF